MLTYNPDKTPDPNTWLDASEDARLAAVRAYHRSHATNVPSLESHAAFHVIVENQIAEPFEPTVRAMARVQRQGLTRHDALHAVAQVIFLHMNSELDRSSDDTPEAAHARLATMLDRLTAKAWRKQTGVFADE